MFWSGCFISIDLDFDDDDDDDGDDGRHSVDFSCDLTQSVIHEPSQQPSNRNNEIIIRATTTTQT